MFAATVTYVVICTRRKKII